MKTYNIGVIPGDGTGPEVVGEALKALRAISDAEGIEFNLTRYDIGGERYLAKGDLLPDSVLSELRGMDASLLGAIGHPGVRPGILETEILLKMRFELDLYINLRPVVLLPGVWTPLKDKGPGTSTSWSCGRTPRGSTPAAGASCERARRARWRCRSR